MFRANKYTVAQEPEPAKNWPRCSSVRSYIELRLCVWSPVHILVRIIIPFHRVDMSVEAASETRSRTVRHVYCATFAYSDNQARHVACRQIHSPHVEQRCCAVLRRIRSASVFFVTVSGRYRDSLDSEIPRRYLGS